MENTNVLISGAGVGGPALAWWLRRYGFGVTVVEKAPGPRPGGQAIDFKGEDQLSVLRRMGILAEVRRRQTGGADVRIVDADGRQITVLPGEFTGGDVEIRRGDLSEILYDESVAAGCAYMFGDSITSLTDTADGVHVTFERGAPRTFDLVVGADGIHSNVRRLAFGPERDFVKFLGYYYALAELPPGGPDGDGDGTGLMYNEPGRMVSLGGPKAPAFFVFASPELTYDRYDAEEMKRLVIDAYAGMGWRTPEILARVREARDLHLDTISRVRTCRYAQGRVALLGDAVSGNTLGGFGTGIAVVGAYVLAGELAMAGGDHHAAFGRYEELMSPYAKVARSGGNAGGFLAPASRAGIWMRDQLFRRSLLLKMMLKMTDMFATNISLPDYPAPVDRGRRAAESR
ncbi:FAD-dependent oxidoreductase [Sphaerisporangium melleum]|uniref:FAD-dependent monooxygenase n=2 Tax=Sphaerisporangium melleum TaxID=321316 RepID=UPI001951ED4B|nr:FAD-dependent monooxygenase [Sphaerisporangium melleum]GII69663.1 FAD-dependent oxidoreductase [Sphaerisporangium melleum]